MPLRRARIWVDSRDGGRYLVWMQPRTARVARGNGGRPRRGDRVTFFDEERTHLGVDYAGGKDVGELTDGELQELLDRAREARR